MNYTARDLAVEALRDRSGNVSARLEMLLGKHQPPADERALAVELAMGVVRRRGTLRAVLRNYLKRPKKPVPPHVRQILAVAIYQMLFLDRVPAFAAVNEAVEQTGRFRRIRYRTMVNAILRSIERDMDRRVEAAAPLAADVVPIDSGSHWHFTRDVLPEPREDMPAWLASALSLPPWLVHRWLKQFGSPGKVVQLGHHANARPPLVVRVNGLKTTPSEAGRRLTDEGWQVSQHANGVSLVLGGGGDITASGAFAQGLIQPQDATATAAGLAASPAPGWRVLDFCAAPGTKTTHLAELMGGRGEIVAVDVSEEKLKRIEDNCARMGHDIVRTCLAERIGELELESFDLVLADVPCSNTGVLARRPEARWRLDPKDIGPMVRDQRLLATAAAAYVKPGGRLVYSTCSMEPEENDAVVRGLIKKLAHFSLVRSKATIPSGSTEAESWHDGGYWAMLQR
jgi:16S rRNA (cytosine967-C5)-methyltransferase